VVLFKWRCFPLVLVTKCGFLGEIVNLSKKIGKDVRKDVKNLEKSDGGWYNFVTKKEKIQEGLHVRTMRSEA